MKNLSLEVLSHVFNELNNCINSRDYWVGLQDDLDDYINYALTKEFYTTQLNLIMKYDTTNEHRQWLLELERYIMNNSYKHDKQPLECFNAYIDESTIYYISGCLEITITWEYSK